MKTHGRLSRVLRPVVLTCCAGALLALPALAGAAPTDNQGSKPAASSGSGTQYTLPSNFHTDAQMASQSPRPYALPSDFGSDVQTGGPPRDTGATPNVVVREIRTVVNGSDRTLTLVLASAALGVALCGSAYAAFRVTRLQRGALSGKS